MTLAKISASLIALTTAASLAACADTGRMAGPVQTDQNPAHHMHYSDQAIADMNGMAGMTNPMVGGAAMYADRTIVENAMNSADHTTLVAAVKAAGLVDTLSSPGPFTAFAPTNAAFDALPMGTVDSLLMPENKAKLTKVLTCHVVAGVVTARDLSSWIDSGGGSYSFTTVGGCPVTATKSGGTVWLKDGMGGMSTITTADVMQSNGVIHVVNKVLLPAM